MLEIIAGLIVGFLAGVLVGRANPSKAAKLAAIADSLKNKITNVSK